MTKIKLSIAVLFLTVLPNMILAQYFTDNNKYVPLNIPLNTSSYIYYGLSEISTNNLDISVVSNYSRTSFPEIRYCQWNQNNSGFFGLFNQYYYTNDNAFFKGCDFVQLRNNAKKDFVVLREDKVMVFQNENNQIQSLVQNIPEGSGLYMDIGEFNFQDHYEDVVVTTGSQVKIFRNTFQGTLDPAYFGPYNISGQIVKIKQFDELQDSYLYGESQNRHDIIAANGNIVNVFLNTNNNQINTVVYASVNVQFPIYDIAVADLDKDGYNDLIVSGNYTASVYKNLSGTGYSQSPVWIYNNQNHISSNPKITISDVDNNGYKDIIIISYQGLTSLFLNNNGSLSSTPDQSLYTLYPGSVPNQVKAADIYNDGATALLISYPSGIKIIDATETNPSPSAPLIQGNYSIQGGFTRPVIKIIDEKVRDFQYYAIYKRRPGEANFSLCGTTTEYEYIDNTENVYTGKGIPINGQRLSYHVKTVDLSNQYSVPSNQINYWIDGGIPDNPGYGENLGTTAPANYFITNYPNPFNPKTVIYYTIPELSDVKISVFNTMGQIVKEYSFTKQSPAAYHIEFDGSNLSSGIYFYKIHAGNFSDVKRMVLVK